MSETFYQIYGNRKEGRRRTKASSATKGYLCHGVEYNQHAAASGPRRGRTRDTYLPIPLLDEETSNPQYSAFNFRLLPVSLYPTFHLKPSTNYHKMAHFHIPCPRESFSKDNLKLGQSSVCPPLSGFLSKYRHDVFILQFRSSLHNSRISLGRQDTRTESAIHLHTGHQRP